MKRSGNALMYGVGGLLLGTAIIEGKARLQARALTEQLQSTQRTLGSIRQEAARERELRQAAEHSRDEQRRIVMEKTNAVAARDAEIVTLKAELAKLREGASKVAKKEDKRS